MISELEAADAESLLLHLAGPAQRIELGLARVRAAMTRLDIPAELPFPVITVAGTNGKGSVVAYLEALFQQAGHHSAAYTSPHIWAFAERLRFDGNPFSDTAWMEKLRLLGPVAEEIPLTYFEASTLAALMLCLEAQPDIAILEVGLGGRLDAVNAVDSTIAIISSIDLDHQALLGPDREHIGAEKAGIIRRQQPVFYGDRAAPCQSVLTAAEQLEAPLFLLGRDFDLEPDGNWRGNGNTFPAPVPVVNSAAQRNNLALALATVHCLRERFPQAWPAPTQWTLLPWLPGRGQRLRPWGVQGPELIVDVAHNPQATRALAARVAHEDGRVVACWGMMADKDLAASVGPLRERISAWWLLAMPDNPRAASPATLRNFLPADQVSGEIAIHDLPMQLDRLAAELGSDDLLLCFGSFHVLAALPPSWFRDTA